MTSDIMDDEKMPCKNLHWELWEIWEFSLFSMQKNHKSKKDQAVSELDPWNRGMSRRNLDGMDIHQIGIVPQNDWFYPIFSPKHPTSLKIYWRTNCAPTAILLTFRPHKYGTLCELYGIFQNFYRKITPIDLRKRRIQPLRHAPFCMVRTSQFILYCTLIKRTDVA